MTVGTAATLSVATGNYVQIGKLVIAFFNVTLSSLNSASGNVFLAGLPMPGDDTTNDTCLTVSIMSNGAAGLNGLGGRGVVGSTRVNLTKLGGGTGTPLQASDITATFNLRGQIIYFTP